MERLKIGTRRRQRDGVSGLKCAPCRVCDGLLLQGAQLMQQAAAELNQKTEHIELSFSSQGPTVTLFLLAVEVDSLHHGAKA